MRLQVRGVDRTTRRRNHIRHQHDRARDILVTDGGGEVDGLVRGQRGVDLTQFDAEPAHLHLEVGAADVFQAVFGTTGGTRPRGPADHVTGAVHPLPRHERIRHETVRGQRGARVVTASDLDTGDVQLTGHPVGHRLQPVVQHQRPDAAVGPAHGERVTGQQRLADVDHDGGLGRAVDVVERADLAAVAERHGPLRQQLGRIRLATDGQHPQAVEVVRFQRRQRRGGDEQMGDLLAPDQLVQLLAAEHAGRNDHQGTARTHREQQLHDRRVEARRREMQCARIGVEFIPRHLLGAEVGQTGVRHHDTLGHTRGTRGVDDVGEVVRTQRPDPIVVGHGVGGVRVQIQVLEHQPFDRIRQLIAHGRHGQADR
ncbi:hypothetical protein NWFMUON74_64190 [Nocardia wallacei]|uniref:Uncharacterized protein n=1 Tax=Nocardia wallacei TaxID=480035 RepID=A0A7G1KTW4_9NOCA|nr:hypothetical protein NWFMUON74_64190 [Nocardia wallacei]